jgi:hypothetical protein
MTATTDEFRVFLSFVNVTTCLVSVACVFLTVMLLRWNREFHDDAKEADERDPANWWKE